MKKNLKGDADADGCVLTARLKMTMIL